MPKPIKVSVANGNELQCTRGVDCPWFTQRHAFSTNFKVLPLESYDVILGMDWLEYHSPMLIDWPCKCMQIEDRGYTIILQGVAARRQSCALLSSVQMASVQKKSGVAFAVHLCYSADSDQGVSIEYQELPPAVAQLLLGFEDIFKEPTELPLTRSCDHKIPLIPGAQPVNIRP